MIKLNKIQKAAYGMIQSDARFMYTLVDIQKKAKNIDSNYILICQPYIGLFVDGAAQWGNKVGLNIPKLSTKEKEYYIFLRNNHKLFNISYEDYEMLILQHFKESDKYFYRIRSFIEKIIGYKNVGTDLCYNKYCGNTILCSIYNPMRLLGNRNIRNDIQNYSVVAGKIASSFDCLRFPCYRYDDTIHVHYKDFHFFKKCPLILKNNLGIVLFSILCSINYVTVFLEKYFVDEIPQKFKYAYLLYYYLCDFICELNLKNNTCLIIDSRFINREFRNCLAHYGLGSYMKEKDIIEEDNFKGLTNKAFDKEYLTIKKEIFDILNNLAYQIENYIFKS